MAATCVARPVCDDNENASCRQRILKSTTGWAERVQFAPPEEVRMGGTYYSAELGRYSLPAALHTANSFPETRTQRPSPTTRNTHIHTTSYKVLVADLLESLTHLSLAYGNLPLDHNDSTPPPPDYNDQYLARARIPLDSTAPTHRRKRSTSPQTSKPATMDFSIDFGDNSGFKTKPSKKKKNATAAKFDPWGTDGNDKKDDSGMNGTGGGGDGGYGGDGGDASGAGGGGDDNNNGGNDDEDWGFSAVKKGKKKTKKQQQEEEEEERKRREEEEAKANEASHQDPLSWADDANDANDANGNDDWGMWGTSKKDKDKKKKKDAALEPTPGSSAFQDINLDDGAPKLDFSFDGLGENKKNETSGGFTTWGKTWDFGSVSKETKKEEPADLGNNNPWGLGGKSKKKTTTSTGFDFGDFGSTGNNDLTFDSNNDVADSKPADDAWGFATQGKKDKKKKGGIEEIKEEPIAESEPKNDDTWGGWGTAKTSKSKKKSTFDDTFADKAVEDSNKDGDMSFDWGFGGSKTKKKDTVPEVVEESIDKNNDGDDWMGGAWGAAGKKKKDKKKGTTEDLSASIDLTSNADAKTVTSDPPADDIWSTFTSEKDKKKTKKGFFDDEAPPEAPEPPPANNDSIWGTFGTKSSKKSKTFDLMSETEEFTESQETKEPLIAWDFGLAAKDKRKKEKQMKIDGTWDSRITQEMVDAAEAEKVAEPVLETVDAEPESEHIPTSDAAKANEELANAVPWDFGLTPIKKRKKEKDMRLEGTWDTRITQDMIDEAKEAVAAAAALAEQEAAKDAAVEPTEKDLADEVPWDWGLDPVARRKKQKDMRADGTWESRITQVIIDEAKAAAEEAKKPKVFEDDLDFEPVQDPELDPLPEPVERVPWDHGLSPKEKRKKEKDMRADGTWDDRLTQEKIDEEVAATAAAAEAMHSYEPDPEPEQLQDTKERQAWDFGLAAKEKKRVERQLKLDGKWESRLTQEMIDEEANAAAFANKEEPNLIPEPEESTYIDPSDKKPWDFGLNTKEKKKLEKQMRQDGTWDTRLTQEQIDEEIAAAAAAVVSTEPELDIAPVHEERVPWDHNLTPKEKRKKEKDMKAAGTWEDRLTQETIEEEAAAAAAEGDQDIPMEDDFAADKWEPRMPWDHGLNLKEKKKKEKEMKLDGTWDDRLTQERIDEEEAAAEATKNAEEPELEPEEQANESWGFGWGASKAKPKRKPLPNSEPEKIEEKAEEGWGGTWGFGLKKTKTKTPVEETPPALPEPEPESKADDVWSFGTSTKDKKKKEKTARKSDLFDAVVEDVEPPPPPPAEDDIWSTFNTKSDKKVSKKTKAKEESPISPPATDLVAEEADAAPPSVDDFDWGGIGSGRKSNKSLAQETSAKKSNKSLVDETPAKKSNKSLVEEAFGKKSSKSLVDETPAKKSSKSLIDEEPAKKSNKSLVEEVSGKKSSKSLVDETPAKKSSKSLIDEEPAKKSSVWGFGSTTSTAKTKKEREAQAKKEAEEQAQREEEERLQREAEEAEEAAKAEAERLAAEEAAKKSKKTRVGKSSKTSKATDDKKKSGDLLDLLDDPVPTPASTSSKLRRSSTRGSEKQLADLQEAEELEAASVEPDKDYFGFWGGSSKKTAGKKNIGSTKEITTYDEDALLAELNEDQVQALLDDVAVPASSKITKTMSNEKPKSSSRIADRVKAFEGAKEDGSKKSKQAEPRLTNVEPNVEEMLSPKEAKKATKGKSSTPTSAKSSKGKVQEAPSFPDIEPKKSKDSVPGSFPGGFADEEEEDLLGIEEALPDQDLDSSSEPPAAKPKKKSAQAEKKVSKTTKAVKKSAEITAMKTSVSKRSADKDIAENTDLLDDEVTLPTPPPETEKKTARKERARVERSATSWGFWGASAPPKKLSRSQTLNDVSPPSSRKTKSPPAVTRTKSTRTTKTDEADTQKESEKASKSSTSDRESATRLIERPKPSRGMSLTNFMLGGAPPSAMRQSQSTKTRRQSTPSHPVSRSSSRRQSMDQSGILSPPLEDESPTAKKATKIMGYAVGASQRRPSTKGKSGSYPDPYPIDDDDMVMIRDNGREDESRSKSKPKNKVVTSVGNPMTKPRSKTLSGDEDVVMVDSPLAIDSANEDFTKPALQRSNTGRKSAGIFGSFFGVSSRTPVERSRSSPVTDNEDNGLPIRSRTSSQKRSRGIDPDEAQGETDAEAAKQAERRVRRSARDQAEGDSRLAREQRRRDRREREKADLETRREKAREQARREREAEEQEKQERRARRREREAAEQARIEREAAEADAAAEKRREERRRQREKPQVESPMYPMTREDRRRTYAGEDEVRRSRKDDRSKSRPTEGFGRRSSVLMAEYHESRSGSGRGVKPPANKTSSWIDSQKEEPPDLPPVEGTVLDESGQAPRPVEDGDSNSRPRRKDRYAGMAEEEIVAYRAKRRERRVVEKSTSSDEKMKKRDKRRSKYEDDFYADPIRTFDGRPALGRSESKRNSFLGRFFAG